MNRTKADGRWEESYGAPKNMVIPEDFIAGVKADKKAFAQYQLLKKSGLCIIGMKF